MSSTSMAYDFTEVRESGIHGLGVFAKVDIPKGTIWWKGEADKNVLLLNRDQYHNFLLSDHAPLKAHFWDVLATYSYYAPQVDALVLCLDNVRYVNHCKSPNSHTPIDAFPLVSVALRDIKQGEEIVEDYDEYLFCPWAEELDKMRWPT
ncbi:MAG: SET domain-containing protein [Saprospiraceae bacterium]|nr:SET domain-containing protein [Saprospiraceae bacterium]